MFDSCYVMKRGKNQIKERGVVTKLVFYWVFGANIEAETERKSLTSTNEMDYVT